MGHRLQPEIPQAVLALLHERLAGLDELEALLLVRGASSRMWTASAVAAELLLPTAWSEPALERLSAAGLLVGAGEGAERRFSYHPATPELEAAVAALAEAYGRHGLDVLRILNAKAFDRIRSAVRTLGDAISSAKIRTKADAPAKEQASPAEPSRPT
jgi:hypothetical protein